MKTNTAAILLALALATPAITASAQDAEKPRNPRPHDGQGEHQPPPNGERPRGQRPDGQGGPGGQGGQGGPGMGMRSPLISALDANNDGEIDAKEIENASKALKKLDKNGDGKLTMDEIRPPRQQGQPGGPGAGNPDGQRPPRGEGNERPNRPQGPPPGDAQNQQPRPQRPNSE